MFESVRSEHVSKAEKVDFGVTPVKRVSLVCTRVDEVWMFYLKAGETGRRNSSKPRMTELRMET